MTEKLDKRRLLTSILAALIREWGINAVRACLLELESLSQEDGSSPSNASVNRRAKSKGAHSAVELAERTDASEEAKVLLNEIALKFDSRAFLPSGVDIRHFLAMRGLHIGQIKKRADAFRRVLPVLMGMSLDELTVFAKTELHSGPTQLGPLSDAISATGAATRTEAHSDENNQASDFGDTEGKQ